MGLNWGNCIITFLDVPGIKAEAPTGKSSSTMRKLHRLVTSIFNSDLSLHQHAYLWNDSALFLAYLHGKDGEKDKVVRELNVLKRYVDLHLGKSTYAIVVKGRTFPHAEQAPKVFDRQLSQQQRVITLKTSSWAMANCFIIEKELRKHRKAWYIDSRVAESISTSKQHTEEKIKLLPKNTVRKIRMYSGYLW